ncbi:MAG: MGMT family protein [Candidatus Methanofastidiosia archaeon]
MSCGYCKYRFLGEEYYIVARGEKKLQMLSLRTKIPPKGCHDNEMKKVAISARRWIFEGNEFLFPHACATTYFQKQVFDILQNVPLGRVTTYKAIAEALGIKCSRAVGGAMKRNAMPLLIPCHRVVKSDRTLGGYTDGIELKELILKNEGVVIQNGKVRKNHIITSL